MKYLGKVQADQDLITKYGTLFPNLDALTPVLTRTINIADTTAHEIANRLNTGMGDATEFDDLVMFRLTVTGTGIYQVADIFIQGTRGLSNPVVYAINRTMSTSAATTGIRYMYFRYPLTLNSGYKWAIDVAAYNDTARTLKIEVFRTESAWTWNDTDVASSYNSTYQSSGTLTLYSSRGIVALGTVPIAASSAGSASYVSSYLTRWIAGTMPLAGEALTANTLCILSGNKVWKASNKTKPIEPGTGILFNSTATSSGSATTYTYLRDRVSWTKLTGDSAMSKGTLARGNPVYLRCTLNNGDIYSDAYLSATMSAGYTWCYIGEAQSNTAINLDLTHALFLTLDSNGKLTHVNGKEISAGTTVVANPTLAGTEADLTGLQVGSTKYKVGGGLPSVSASDNGKVLTVVSGAWAAAALPLYDGTVE